MNNSQIYFHIQLTLYSCEAARHCRWVDEVVSDAPWIIDADFVSKWEIDYVAHDEDPYGAQGHDDVYSFVKAEGKPLPLLYSQSCSPLFFQHSQVSSYRPAEHPASQHPNCSSALYLGIANVTLIRNSRRWVTRSSKRRDQTTMIGAAVLLVVVSVL